MSRRVAVVTGAAGGIGRATAELLAGDHRGVVVVGLPEDDFGWADGRTSIDVIRGDVRDPQVARDAASRALERHGSLDTLVLNAGIAGRGSLEDMELEAAQRIVDINYWGAVHGIRGSLDALRSGESPAVVLTASVSGLGADPGHWAYGSSKAAVVNLVREAAWDLARYGIRVNAVAPGPIHTPLTARIGAHDRDRYDGLRLAAPLARWGEPEEVAHVIAFLASPAASYVTGVVVPVDGGISAGSGLFRPAHDPGA